MKGGDTSARIDSSDRKREPAMVKRDTQKAMVQPSTSAPASAPKPTTMVLKNDWAKRHWLKKVP